MSVWGPLAQRYEKSAPRKILSLDGGGIRGVLTLQIIAEIERQLRGKSGKGDEFRLCDYFDYIGGTSTGSIIAAGLALGMSADEMIEFYSDMGPKIFDKSFILKRLKYKYEDEPLAKQLRSVFGKDTDLSPEYLKCLLLVVTQNVSTDSPWPISSNPMAKYNDTSRPDCNLRIPLWQLVRASTAAPVYFPPEVLQWDSKDPDKSFVFVDGGVTPYNNPSFLMYRMAVSPPYKLTWEKGEEKMLVVSVGTGSAPKESDGSPYGNLLSAGKNAPGNLMYVMSINQDINCRTVGRCTWGSPVDRELGDMIPRDDSGRLIPLSQNLGRDFLYMRYNAELSEEGLAGLALQDIDPEKVCKLDSIKEMKNLTRIGKAVAREVKLDHFGPFMP